MKTVPMPENLFGETSRKKRTLADSPVGQRVLLFARKWQERYQGEQYIVSWGMDMKWMKELESVPMDTLTERIDLYLRNAKFGELCRHSLPAFVKNINQFIPQHKNLPSNLPKQHLQCPDCGSSYEFGKECGNPECPTNAWKKLTTTGEEARRQVMSFLSGNERGEMKSLDGKDALSDEAKNEIKDIKQQEQRRKK